MPTGITETIFLNDQVVQKVTTGGGSGNVLTNLTDTPTYAFSNGTSTGGTVAGVIDLVVEFCKTPAADNSITLASSAVQTFIMSALVDPVSGATNNFVRLRKLSVQVIASTGNDSATLAPGGTHGLAVLGTTPGITTLEEKVWNNPAGLVIVSGTTDQITLTNNGSAPMSFNVRFSGNST